MSRVVADDFPHLVFPTGCSRYTPKSGWRLPPPRPALADGLRLFESSLCCLFESESLVKFPHGVPYPVFPRPYPQFGMEVASRPGEDRLMDLRLHGRCQSTPIGVVEGEQIANSVHVRAAPMRSQPETRRSCCRTARHAFNCRDRCPNTLTAGDPKVMLQNRKAYRVPPTLSRVDCTHPHQDVHPCGHPQDGGCTHPHQDVHPCGHPQDGGCFRCQKEDVPV